MSDKAEAFFPVHHLPPYVLGEVGRAVRDARVEGRDIIDLSQFNPSLPPPGTAVERLVQSSLQLHNHRYSSSQGITKLREAAAGFYDRRFGVTLDVETELVVTMGIKEGLSHLLFAVASPGDSVLIPAPVYPIHEAAVTLAGASVIRCPLPVLAGHTPDGAYRASAASLASPGAPLSSVLETYSRGSSRPSASAREQTSVLTENDDAFFQGVADTIRRTWPRPILMIVSFPHNPTGTVVTKGFFERLVALAHEYKIYLVHDFAYADICYDGYQAPSILSVDGAKEVAVELYSLSKGFNLGGWRVGFCAGNEKLVHALRKIKGFLDCGIFQPLQIAAVKLLERHDGIVRETADTYRARRDILVEGLQRIGWSVQAPKGAVFVWAELPPNLRGMCGVSVVNSLLQDVGIACSPGEGFDPFAENFVRFALGESEPRLRSAVERLANWGPFVRAEQAVG